MSLSKTRIYIFTALLLMFVPMAMRAEEQPTEEEFQAQLQAQEDAKQGAKLLIPDLQVNIPGLNLDNSIVYGEGKEKNECPVGYVCSKTIDSYLNGVYRFAAGASVTFAIVLIMVGGAQYAVGSAAGSIDAGKKRMVNAVTGLVILLSAHAILTFVNPSIASFTGLELEIVTPKEDTSRSTLFGGESVHPGIADGNLLELTPNKYLITNGTQGIHKDVWADFPEVARTFYDKTSKCIDRKWTPFKPNKTGPIGSCQQTGEGIKLKLSSGGRSVQEQARMFYENCLAKGGTCDPITCNPFPRDGSGPVLKDDNKKYVVTNDVLNQFEEGGDISTNEQLKQYLVTYAVNYGKTTCPHNTGFAVDVWPATSANFISFVPHHLQMEQVMQSEGWCRLLREPWHFEYQSNIISKQGTDCNWEIGTMKKWSAAENAFVNFEYWQCPWKVNFKTGQCINERQAVEQLVTNPPQ